MRKVGTKSRCGYCKQPIRWSRIKDWFTDTGDLVIDDNICEAHGKLTNQSNLDHEPMVFNDYINLIKL